MRLKLLLVVALLVSAAHADVWNKHYAVSGEPSLYLKAGDGHVRVTSSDSPEISVRVVTDGYRIAPDEVTIEESQEGGGVRVVVRVPRGMRLCIGICVRRIEIDVTVPRRTNLDLRTDDGNITVAHVRGEFRLHTGDGHMELHNLDGSLVASSGDGHISADGRFDRLDLSSGDGRIEADAERGSKVATTWRLRSGDGSVTLRLPDDFAAELDATTGDGSVDVDLPMNTRGRMRESRVHGLLNGGGGLISVHTGDGHIRIGRL
ncbi:MAG TPA: DUF4097 family beta strand repeat-containing protein [Terriglobales bacterium]|nr:DUF4097 family beta strand repeat-containing protein [Terriglobales bacterium]